MMPFRTVRGKLTGLVALSAVTTLAELPVLDWVMTSELADAVADRVPDAVRAFNLELGDDVRDLDAATLSLADSDELAQSMKTHAAREALGELKVFHDAYPGTAFVAYANDGAPFASIGLSGSPPHGSAERALLNSLKSGEQETRLVVHSGCSEAPSKESAYIVVRRVRDRGGRFPLIESLLRGEHADRVLRPFAPMLPARPARARGTVHPRHCPRYPSASR